MTLAGTTPDPLSWAPAVDEQGKPSRYAIRRGEAQIAKTFHSGKTKYSLFWRGQFTGQVFDNAPAARDAGDALLVGEKVTPPKQHDRKATDDQAAERAIASARQLLGAGD